MDTYQLSLLRTKGKQLVTNQSQPVAVQTVRLKKAT